MKPITRTAARAASVLAISAAALAPASAAVAKTTPAAKPVVKTIAVQDDMFMPMKLTIKAGTEVKWVWSTSNYDSHNVTLESGPKGVSKKAFTSVTGTSGINFERKFTVPGTYHFECTIHPESMNLTIVVTK